MDDASPRIEASYILEMDDLVALTLAHGSRSKMQKRARNLVPILAALASICAILLAFLAQGEAERQLYCALAVLVPAIGIIFYFIYPKILSMNVRNAYAEGANRMLLSPTVVRAGERFEIVHEGYGRSEVEWRGVDKVTVTPDHVFVYVSALGAHIVPRRGFQSDQDFSDFAAFLAEKTEAALGGR